MYWIIYLHISDVVADDLVLLQESWIVIAYLISWTNVSSKVTQFERGEGITSRRFLHSTQTTLPLYSINSGIFGMKFEYAQPSTWNEEGRDTWVRTYVFS